MKRTISTWGLRTLSKAALIATFAVATIGSLGFPQHASAGAPHTITFTTPTATASMGAAVPPTASSVSAGADLAGGAAHGAADRPTISATSSSTFGARAGTVVTATASCDPGGHKIGQSWAGGTTDNKNPQFVTVTPTDEDSDTTQKVVGVVITDLAPTQALSVTSTVECGY